MVPELRFALRTFEPSTSTQLSAVAGISSLTSVSQSSLPEEEVHVPLDNDSAKKTVCKVRNTTCFVITHLDPIPPPSLTLNETKKHLRWISEQYFRVSVIKPLL